MSTTAVTYPIVAAVKGAERILGPKRIWIPMRPEQGRFLTEHFVPCSPEIDLIDEIETLATWDYQKLVAWLAKRGFQSMMTPFQEGEFGVASVLDLLVEWIEKGGVTTVRTPDNREFPGVRIGKQGVRFFESSNHPNPIALLKTVSGDLVYMTMLGDAPQGFDLVTKAQELSQALQDHSEPLQDTWYFEGLVFPMVNLNEKKALRWLLGMSTSTKGGQRARISQAFQQTKLRMNEVGARAQSAVEIGIALTSFQPPAQPHVINRPFLVWFERKGLTWPLFVAHVTEEDWKNPGDITKNETEQKEVPIGHFDEDEYRRQKEEAERPTLPIPDEGGQEDSSA